MWLEVPGGEGVPGGMDNAPGVIGNEVPGADPTGVNGSGGAICEQ
jgi:hypothetical protein